MASKTIDHKAGQTLNLSQWFRLVLIYLLVPLILLIAGWDLGWWQAWVASLLFFATGMGGHIWAERRHPGLLAERMRAEKAPGVKAWDRVLAPLMGVSVSYPLYIVAGLDHRFGWSTEFSVWINLLGLILIALGDAFALWASLENRFFSTMVRIQLDRGHRVCDSGPYRIVRHPGYAGITLTLPGVVLALASMWTIIPAAAAVAAVMIRTALEDRTLQAELPGYAAYARKTRFRLIPGLW